MSLKNKALVAAAVAVSTVGHAANVGSVAEYAKGLPGVLAVYRHGVDGFVAPISDTSKLLGVEARLEKTDPIPAAARVVKAVLGWEASHGQVAPFTTFTLTGDAPNMFITLSFPAKAVRATDWSLIQDGALLDLSDSVAFDAVAGEAAAINYCGKTVSTFCRHVHASKARLDGLQ